MIPFQKRIQKLDSKSQKLSSRMIRVGLLYRVYLTNTGLWNRGPLRFLFTYTKLSSELYIISLSYIERKYFIIKSRNLSKNYKVNINHHINDTHIWRSTFCRVLNVMNCLYWLSKDPKKTLSFQGLYSSFFLKRLAHNGPKPFFSQSSPAHSPKLIFHVVNKDSSVSLSVVHSKYMYLFFFYFQWLNQTAFIKPSPKLMPNFWKYSSLSRKSMIR